MNKSFWNRPEGITGVIFITLIFFLIWWFLPQLLLLLTNQVTAIGVFVVIAGIVYVLIDSNLRNKSFQSFQKLMYQLTSLFIVMESPLNQENALGEWEKSLSSLDEVANHIAVKITHVKDFMDIEKLKNPNKSIILKPKNNKKQKSLKLQYLLGKLEELNEEIYRLGQVGLTNYKELKTKVDSGMDKSKLKDFLKQTNKLIFEIQARVNLANDFMEMIDLQKKQFDDKILEILEKQLAQKITDASKHPNQTMKNTKTPNIETPKNTKGDNKYRDLFN